MSATLSARLRRWWNSTNRARKPVRRVSLGVELLETRVVPSNIPPNQIFLATVYQGELGRPIDGFGLVAWDNALNQNVSRTQVVGAILNSPEYLTREVSTDFNALLGRDPDPSGLQYFVQTLQHGATPQQLESSIMGSDEFFARVSGSDSSSYSFLNAVYEEVLNRPVDISGIYAWAPLASNAASRTAVVNAVEASLEATQRFVATTYQDILGRAPDTGGLAYWAGQLQHGASQSTILANVLGSDEFFNRMQTYTAPLSTSDPNVAAATFISQANLFTLKLPVVPPAPPPVPPPPPAPSGGDNSGFDVPPADNTGGDVLGNNNAGGIPVTIDIPVIDTTPPYVPDTTIIDTTPIDTSSSGSTDIPSTDCPCDPGTTDTTGFSSDPGFTDTSSDPTSGF